MFCYFASLIFFRSSSLTSSLQLDSSILIPYFTSNKSEIIEYLLRNAYDPLYVDCNGKSCADYLSWNKNKKMYPVVKSLLDAYTQDGLRHNKEKRELLGWNWLAVGFDFYKQHRFD